MDEVIIRVEVVVLFNLILFILSKLFFGFYLVYDVIINLDLFILNMRFCENVVKEVEKFFDDETNKGNYLFGINIVGIG